MNHYETREYVAVSTKPNFRIIQIGGYEEVGQAILAAKAILKDEFFCVLRPRNIGVIEGVKYLANFMGLVEPEGRVEYPLITIYKYIVEGVECGCVSVATVDEETGVGLKRIEEFPGQLMIQFTLKEVRALVIPAVIR